MKAPRELREIVPVQTRAKAYSCEHLQLINAIMTKPHPLSVRSAHGESEARTGSVHRSDKQKCRKMPMQWRKLGHGDGILKGWYKHSALSTAQQGNAAAGVAP